MIKYIFMATFILFNKLSAQVKYFNENEFIDTGNIQMKFPCREANVYYYQMNGKYPESSANILNKVKKFTSQLGIQLNESGYITFRFLIDCDGKIVPKIEVLQIDEKFQKTRFNEKLVTTLYTFIKSLNPWPKASLNGEIVPIAYHTFLTFKIHHGQVINVIP